ncbi:MAG: HAMP domain-containing histidine kinase [Gemmatimonadota bacterium]|nr:MAG: HAMP domain-containing histidine kinase [Gemmatimonadota bacterium]
MKTIRGRLAVSYAVAMIATLAVFAVALYMVERSWSREQIDQRLRIEADLIAAIISVARETHDSAEPIDTTILRPIHSSTLLVLGAELTPDVEALVEGVSDYVLLLGSDPYTALVGYNARAERDSVATDAFAAAARETLESENQFGEVNLDGGLGSVRYFVRSLASEETQPVAAVVCGVPTAEVAVHLQNLISMLLLISPLIILVSTAIAYVLAGRTLQPVDNIVDEVEAITDGRSLHRRLATPRTKDELTRLITTLNAMLTRLESSFRALRRFTADASHELKTPLTVLRSGIERAITHPRAKPEVLEVLDETLVEVKRMTELVDSLLTLARADEGRAPLHLEEIDLRDLMGEIAETAGILGEQASVSVSVALPNRKRVLSVDRNRIRQLMMNLLTNAIKYTPAGGRVTIDADVRGDDVVFKVSDTGIGIAPGELPHVFDRFWRADPARSRTGQRSGAGLGLAICKWIAEAHGGSIQVNSRPGKGTTMTVVLPMGGGLPRSTLL